MLPMTLEYTPAMKPAAALGDSNPKLPLLLLPQTARRPPSFRQLRHKSKELGKLKPEITKQANTQGKRRDDRPEFPETPRDSQRRGVVVEIDVEERAAEDCRHARHGKEDEGQDGDEFHCARVVLRHERLVDLD